MFRLFRSLVALLAIISISNGLQAADDGEFLLRYKFNEGEVARYEVSLHDDYTVQAGNLKESPLSHQDSVKSYRVLSVKEDGSAVLELTVMEWVKSRIETNGGKATWDSRVEKKHEPIFDGIAGMVGVPQLKLTISPRGETSDIVLLNKKDLKNQEEEELTANVLLELPEKAVKLGGMWKEEVLAPIMINENSPLKQNIRLQKRFVVTGYQAGIATIDMKTIVLTPVSDVFIERQLLRRQPHGIIRFDVKNGRLLSQDFQQQNQVLNFSGAGSMLKFEQKHTEKLLTIKVAADEQSTATR